MLRGLVKLIRYMDGLSAPADLPLLEQLLRDADVTREELVVACKFSDKNYARNLLAKGTWYQLLVICWRTGQMSPIHDHGTSACGVRVVDGVATEQLYQETKPGEVVLTESRRFTRDQVCITSRDDIHVICNEEDDVELVTLHLYSPPLKMQFFEEEMAADR